MKKIVFIIVGVILVVMVVGVGCFFGFQISVDEAREMAQDRVSDSSATLVAEATDRDLLTSEYEFTFASDQTRYEVKVNSFGHITDFEQEQILTAPETTPSNSPEITQEEARQIALNQHPQGQVIGLDLDWEHGRLEYEIEIREGSYEYEYTIDGTTGNIIKSSQDSVYD